jgi:hypothetical protein
VNRFVPCLKFVCAQIVLVEQLSFAQQVPLPKKINIICTDNHDSTGQCYDVKTNTILKCTGVPGEIVPCRTPGGLTYNCLFFSQALLECNQLNTKVGQEEVSKTDENSAFDSDLYEVTNDPSINNRFDRLIFDLKPGDEKDINTKTKLNESINEKRPIILPTW